MLYKSTFILALSALARAAPQVVSPATMGGSCTTVTPPGETGPIVDSAGNTLSCDGSAYQAVSTAVVTNLITATVTASGSANPTTIVSTYMPAEASANAAIGSATASINSAMAQATPAVDRSLWRGALSVANPKPDVDLTFRGRISEISEALWSIKREWIPARIFQASNYSANVTDPKEWQEILAGNKPGHNGAVYESADKQQLYAQVSLWPGGEGVQLNVNTTWTPTNDSAPFQQWKDAILSTLQLPIVQDTLIKKGWPSDPSGLPRDDQTLLAYGMIYGDLPVKRKFIKDPLKGIADALEIGYYRTYPTLVHTLASTVNPFLKPDTTYIVTGYQDEYKKNGELTMTKYATEEWRVRLGIWSSEGHPEDAGFQAQVRLADLLKATDYMIHKQTRTLELTNCGWRGKTDKEDYCP